MTISKHVVSGGVAAAAVVIAGLALYGSGSRVGNLAEVDPCPASAETARRVAPLARGEVAAFQVSASPRPVPLLRFAGPDGAVIDLMDFRGRTVLLNLWATWCAPCKAEMPALDRLQAEFGGDRFEVAAINIETRNLDRPPAWLKAAGIVNLKAYRDPDGRVLPVLQQETGSPGLPTTLLIDGQGCQIGVMKGPADWASEDGRRLIGAALGPGS